MSLLADILGGGNQSRLYQKLTVEKKIAAYAGAWFSADMLDYGTFGLYAAPNAGVAIEEVEKGVDEVLADLIAKGITQEELDRSRNSVIAERHLSPRLAGIAGARLRRGTHHRPDHRGCDELGARHRAGDGRGREQGRPHGLRRQGLGHGHPAPEATIQ